MITKKHSPSYALKSYASCSDIAHFAISLSPRSAIQVSVQKQAEILPNSSVSFVKLYYINRNTSEFHSQFNFLNLSL